MARIRSIKPDAFTSDTLSSVSVLARWTFAGLWTYCDDAGRGRADARLIKAALFPIDDKTALSDVQAALGELEEVGAICRYRVGNKTYLHVPKWDEHQKINRPTDSKLPDCPACSGGGNDASEPSHDGLTESSVSPPDGKGTGKGREQGSESARERVSDSYFDAFWAAYPRKTDKAKSRKAWDKAVKKQPPEFLIAAAGQFAVAKRETDRQFIPHPSTWLNGERWEDEQPALSAVPGNDWMRRRPS